VTRPADATIPEARSLAFLFHGQFLQAFLYGPRIALVGALFQQAYIWVHYWFTEKPDMDLIYGQ
jgi:hypothetical protein